MSFLGLPCLEFAVFAIVAVAFLVAAAVDLGVIRTNSDARPRSFARRLKDASAHTRWILLVGLLCLFVALMRLFGIMGVINIDGP